MKALEPTSEEGKRPAPSTIKALPPLQAVTKVRDSPHTAAPASQEPT